MKRLLGIALASVMFCGPALAVNAPDSAVVSGPNNEQTPIMQLRVTIPGQAQTTLGAALAAAGGGCVTNCSFTGLTAAAGISDLSAPGGSSLVGGGLGITTTGDLSSIQNVPNWDSAVTDHKSQTMTATLGTVGTATHTWENFDPDVILTGITTGEINVMHPGLSVRSGASMNNGEAVEAEIINAGTTTGTIQSVLAIAINTGTMAQYIGYQNSLTNTGGALGEYDQFNCQALTGAAPTFSYCLKNNDATSKVATLGQLLVGTITPIANTETLSVKSFGSTSATRWALIKNSANATMLNGTDDGTLNIGGQVVSGTLGGAAGGIRVVGTTSGAFQLLPSSQTMVTTNNITVPSTQADTIAMLGAGQTFTSSIGFTGNVTVNPASTFTMNGTENVTSTIKYSGLISYVNTLPTIASGFGTGATVVTGNGTGWFQIGVGTGASASSGILTLAATSHAWSCIATDVTNPAGNATIATSTTTTAVALTNYSRTTGTATAWPASDVINVSCQGG